RPGSGKAEKLICDKVAIGPSQNQLQHPYLLALLLFANHQFNSTSITMGVSDIVPNGVLTGDNVLKLFEYAREKKFALPAVNVTSSSTVIATLEAARDKKSPIIIQISQGGAAFFAGKGISNAHQKASIAGSVAAAHFIRAIAPSYNIPIVIHTDHCAMKLLSWLDGMLDADEKYFEQHGEPLFSSHMVDFSEETKEKNIEITKKYLQRAAPMKQWLEMEIGITGISPNRNFGSLEGGVEDGCDNTGVTNSKLYTQPEDVWDVYSTLTHVSPYFSIAAAFGNGKIQFKALYANFQVHGVYILKVRLAPELLEKHQEYAAHKLGKKGKPLYLVMHGGSGSTHEEFRTAINNGVIKINLDTDLQYAYLTACTRCLRKDYLMTQCGNPEGDQLPNKSYYDPRVWIRYGEQTMKVRVAQALDDFGAAGTL
ncbi:Fructose-bisphosphate aldolase 1, partial [Neolecta irregularis DAH-3]